jgi:hypothetical protein
MTLQAPLLNNQIAPVFISADLLNRPLRRDEVCIPYNKAY